MIPKVILYNSVSLDGRIKGFNADTELYYKIASDWDIDAVLMGSTTILEGFSAKLGESGEKESFKDRRVRSDLPLLVVPDSAGQIRIWDEVLTMPYIGDLLVLCSRSTPSDYLDFLDTSNIKYMIVGYDKVDLGTALEELNTQFNVKSIRVDGGGSLNGALLRDDLVEEIFLLLHPTMVGGDCNSIYEDIASKAHPLDLRFISMEEFNDEIILLRYRVMKYKF